MIEKITKYVNHWRGGECLCCVKVSSWNHKENDLTVLKLQLSIKSTCYRFQVPFKIKANVSGQDKNYQTLIVPHCNAPSPTWSNLAYSFQLPTSKGMRTPHTHKASISPVPMQMRHPAWDSEHHELPPYEDQSIPSLYTCRMGQGRKNQSPLRSTAWEYKNNCTARQPLFLSWGGQCFHSGMNSIKNKMN